MEALAFGGKQIGKKDFFDCLHVRSISEWAPTCIGPYSQASKIRNLFVFCAGVIGLVPATMQMIKNSKPKQQIHRAVKNLSAVLSAFGSDISSAIHHNVFVLSSATAKHKQLIADCEHLVHGACIFVPDLPKHALVEIQTLALTKASIRKLETIKSEMEMQPIKAQPIKQEEKSEKKPRKKLKYSHLKRKKKKKKAADIYEICREAKESEIGNCLRLKTKAIYNLHDKWCSVVSICELSSQQNGHTISKLIKSALAQSILFLNGYGHGITHIKEEDVETEWTQRSIVFLRLYYHAEALEPTSLMERIEECFCDLGIDKVPAISLIPCRGVCFVNDIEKNSFGLYMLHCFLHEN